MAVLNAADRNAMPSGEFAGPDRSFPIPDVAHARLAISMAPRARAAGHITREQEQAITTHAKNKLKSMGHPVEDDENSVQDS